MHKQTNNYMKMCRYKNKMSDVEKDTLLSELLGVVIFKDRESKLIPLLLSDNLEAYKELIISMNFKGEKIKEQITIG